MKLWRKITIAGIIGLAGLVAKYEYNYVPVQERVIREYGNPSINENYGFELKSNKGRIFYINFNAIGKGGREKLIALSEAIKEGSLVEFIHNSLYEKRNIPKRDKYHLEVAYPSDVRILESYARC